MKTVRRKTRRSQKKAESRSSLFKVERERIGGRRWLGTGPYGGLVERDVRCVGGRFGSDMAMRMKGEKQVRRCRCFVDVDVDGEQGNEAEKKKLVSPDSDCKDRGQTKKKGGGVEVEHQVARFYWHQCTGISKFKSNVS